MKELSYFSLRQKLGAFEKLAFPPGPQDELILEIHQKINQLSYLSEKIHSLNSYLITHSFEDRFQSFESHESLLQLFSECFYHLAFCLKELVHYLPGLKNFDAEGIRVVRTKLLTHLDKSKNNYCVFWLGTKWSDNKSCPRKMSHRAPRQRFICQ